MGVFCDAHISCCNLQSRVRTHAVLVIGLYELLGNPTTYLIEPPGWRKPKCQEIKKNIEKADTSCLVHTSDQHKKKKIFRRSSNEHSYKI